jgi:hypothetical protein
MRVILISSAFKKLVDAEFRRVASKLYTEGRERNVIRQ